MSGLIVFGAIVFVVYWSIKNFKAGGVVKSVVLEKKQYLPYHAKKYFFSQSEQQFFNILNSHIDAHRYTIFPKVRLGDFIDVDHQDRGNRTWWNKIRAKHIDYLIWDLVENKIVLAIELDGNSHNSEKMQQRDKFVNELYIKVGVKLERVNVGTSFEEESIRLMEML